MSNPVEIVQDGKVYQWVRHAPPQTGDICLNADGYLGPVIAGTFPKSYAIFRLKPVRHTFGGVVFEDVGERVSQTEPGSWFCGPLGNIQWSAQSVRFSNGNTCQPVRPVAIEGQE